MNPNQRKTHLAMIFLVVFIYLVGFGIIIPQLPLLAKNLGASPTEVGLLMSIYSIMQFLFAPFWGRQSDFYGRRKILIGCLVGEGLSYLLLAYSESYFTAFLARAFAGVFGASISTASAAISDVSEPSERSRSMAVVGAAFGLGFLLGPALGGGLAWIADRLWLDESYGIRLSSLSVSAICFLTAFMAFWKLKESAHLRNHNEKTKSSRLTVLGGFLRKSQSNYLLIAYLMTTLSLALMEATLVLLVADRFRWSVKEITWGFAYIGLLSVLNQGLIVRKLLPILGEKIILYLGLCFYFLGFFGIAFSHSISLLSWSMTFLSIGNGFTSPALLGCISLSASDKEQGEILGTAQSMASLGRIMGPTLGGMAYQVNQELPFLLAALGIALTGYLIWWRRKDIPVSAKKDQISQIPEIDLIESFQFNNLIYNRVPFILLCDDIPFEEVYRSPQIEYIKNIQVKVSFHRQPEDWAETLKRRELPESLPIVIFREEGPVPVKLLKKFLRLVPHTNVCLVNQSWFAVKKDLIGGIF